MALTLYFILFILVFTLTSHYFQLINKQQVNYKLHFIIFIFMDTVMVVNTIITIILHLIQ